MSLKSSFFEKCSKSQHNHILGLIQSVTAVGFNRAASRYLNQYQECVQRPTSMLETECVGDNIGMLVTDLMY